MTRHIEYLDDKRVLRLLDQRQLPLSEAYMDCANCRDVIAAIKSMVVRGAPALGVSAAYACVLAAHEYAKEPNWRQKTGQMLDELARARPTAVNLSWAVEKLRPDLFRSESAECLYGTWLEKARKLQRDDLEICQRMGKAGAALIKDGDCVLTHCNAGSLATAGYGTALGVIRAAHAEGKKISVIADETRPLLQGARLTAWELEQEGIETHLACDNACAHLMGAGLVQLVITGADRVAANGDTANKIGTFGVAILARHFGIPFYIACPLSTIDATLKSGKQIPIEKRPADEVRRIGSTLVCPPDMPVYNFAFDVTPAALISGIITEIGILRPPYTDSIARALAKGDSCPA